LMGIFFKYLILFFENYLTYDYSFKSFYLVLSVLLSFLFYVILSLFIKAFKYNDIKLKY
jgi:putative peptidoglycan lipid II flippase